MKKILFLITIFLTVSCTSQKNKNLTQKIINVVLIDVSKINLNTNEISKITGIEQSFFTTSICFKSSDGSKKKCLPVNDKKFNYSYFNTEIYPNFKDRKVKLYIDIYNYNDKEFLVISKIE